MRIRPASSKTRKSALLAITAGLLALYPLIPSRADGLSETDKVLQHSEWLQKWIAGAESLSRKEIKAMSAKEFIDVLKKHTLVFVGDHVEGKMDVDSTVPDWPPESDLPYLLSLIDNEERCAKTISGVFPTVPEDYQTVGQEAFFLLSAIKQGEYSLNIKNENKETLIAWAKEEAKKLAPLSQADTSQHDQKWFNEWNAGAESLSRKEIKAMSAKQFISVLKKHTVVKIGKDEDWYEFGVHTEISDWPNKSDIPYLLSQIDNQEPCAGTDYPMFPIPREDYSTIGHESLLLLQAIKNGEYKYGIIVENKETLIAWAKEEAKKIWLSHMAFFAFLFLTGAITLIAARKYRHNKVAP